MITLLKQLLYDPKAFIAAWTSTVSIIRGIIAAIGFAFLSGHLTLHHFGQVFGPFGYYFGGFLMLVSFVISSGDRTPPELKLLAEELRKQNKPAELTDFPPTPVDAVKKLENELKKMEEEKKEERE